MPGKVPAQESLRISKHQIISNPRARRMDAEDSKVGANFVVLLIIKLDACD
jgi:hypothetical protein